MNRRDFISVSMAAGTVGLVSCQHDTKCKEEASAIWDEETKLFILYKSATLGFSKFFFDKQRINSLKKNIEMLFNEEEDIGFPVNFEFDRDKMVKIGETWVDAVYSLDIFYEQYRKKSLRTWLIHNINIHADSLRQQLLFFWLNHFGISDVIEHKFEYRHIKLLHEKAWGNYKDLIKAITIDSAMLRFLNGSENTRQSPNENYARELLELFTLGKGKLSGTGDYTTFTESDVAESAKILTGWKYTGWFTRDENIKVGASFSEVHHDTGNKKLSHRFNNAVIKNDGSREYESLIDLIFERKETAEFICSKLYRWFVDDDIEDIKARSMIGCMADLLRKNNYEVKPALIYLFESDDFYQIKQNTCRISNPLQFCFRQINFIPVKLPDDSKLLNNFWNEIFIASSYMGMEVMRPPSVAGWKAYYQQPGLSKLWINASTLQSRKKFVDDLTINGFLVDNHKVEMDTRAYINNIGGHSPADFIYVSCKYLFSRMPDEYILNYANKILLKDIGEDSWPDSMNHYLRGKDNALLETNVKQMLNYLLNLPQINIS